MKTAQPEALAAKNTSQRAVDPLTEAMVRRRRLGTSEFFVSPGHMLQLLRQALGELPRPVLSLNRPHVGGEKLVHRLEWRELVFTCVTRKPLTIA